MGTSDGDKLVPQEKKHPRVHIQSKHSTYVYPILNNLELHFSSLLLKNSFVSIFIHIYQLTSEAWEGGKVAIVIPVLHVNELRFKCLNQSHSLTMQPALSAELFISINWVWQTERVSVRLPGQARMEEGNKVVCVSSCTINPLHKCLN